MSNKNKVWGQGDAASLSVGKAKMQGLERVDVPFLSASGPGFRAFKKGDFREIQLENDAPQSVMFRFATHDYTTIKGTNYYRERSCIAQGLHEWSPKGAHIDGLYAGRGMGYAAMQGNPEPEEYKRDCKVIVKDTQVPSNVNKTEEVTRWQYASLEDWGVFAVDWTRVLGTNPAIRSAAAWLGNVRMQVSHKNEYGISRAIALGFDGDALVLLQPFGVLGKNEDDYEFPTVEPRIGWARFSKKSGQSGGVAKLEPPDDTTAIHTYGIGTPIALGEGKAAVLVAEYFQPQMFSYDENENPSNPRGRLLLYTSDDWGESFEGVEVPLGNMLPEQPEASTESAPVIRQDKEYQEVAWKASDFECQQNLFLFDFINGNGIASGDDAIIWFNGIRVEIEVDDEKKEFYGIYAWRISLSGPTIIRLPLLEPSEEIKMPWVDVVRVEDGVFIARVRYEAAETDTKVEFFRSKDYGRSWQKLNMQGIPAGLGNRAVGLPSVYRKKRNGTVQLLMPVKLNERGQDKSVLMLSEDDGSTWERAASMTKLTQAAFFMFPISTWGGISTRVNDGSQAPLYYYSASYSLGYGRIAIVRDRKGKLLPADPICPWILDGQYED